MATTTFCAMNHEAGLYDYYPSILHIYYITCQPKPANLQLCGVATPIIYTNTFIWYNCFPSVINAMLLQMSPILFCLPSVFLPTIH